jgi:hypothetical protein
VFYEYTPYPYVSALFTDFRISEISLANGPKSAIYPLPSRPKRGALRTSPAWGGMRWTLQRS